MKKKGSESRGALLFGVLWKQWRYCRAGGTDSCGNLREEYSRMFKRPQIEHQTENKNSMDGGSFGARERGRRRRAEAGRAGAVFALVLTLHNTCTFLKTV